MQRPTRYIFGAIFTAATIVYGAGCTSSGYNTSRDAVELSIQPSNDRVYVGDTVTVVSRTQNTLGRNAELRWESTGGTVTTEKEGAVARVKFDRPGTYNVNAILSLDGQEVKRETTSIEVANIE